MGRAKAEISLVVLHVLLKLPKDIRILAVDMETEHVIGESGIFNIYLEGENLPDVPRGSSLPEVCIYRKAEEEYADLHFLKKET